VTENYLNLDQLQCFSKNLEILEMSYNSILRIRLPDPEVYKNLIFMDLSFNKLNGDCFSLLGKKRISRTVFLNITTELKKAFWKTKTGAEFKWESNCRNHYRRHHIYKIKKSASVNELSSNSVFSSTPVLKIARGTVSQWKQHRGDSCSRFRKGSSNIEALEVAWFVFQSN